MYNRRKRYPYYIASVLMRITVVLLFINSSKIRFMSPKFFYHVFNNRRIKKKEIWTTVAQACVVVLGTDLGIALKVLKIFPGI